MLRDTGTFTIQDNDPVPTVSIGDAPTITEGGDLSFPLTLTNATADTVSVTVNPAASGTSATWDANDLAAPAGSTASIAPGATTASFVIHANDDDIYEGGSSAAEQVNVTVLSSLNAYRGNTAAAGLVKDNDPLPVLHIADASPFTVAHGQAMTFQATLDRPTQVTPVSLTVRATYTGTGCNGTRSAQAPLGTSGTYSNTSRTIWSYSPCATSVTMEMLSPVNATLPGGTANHAHGAFS